MAVENYPALSDFKPPLLNPEIQLNTFNKLKNAVYKLVWLHLLNLVDAFPIGRPRQGPLKIWTEH